MTFISSKIFPMFVVRELFKYHDTQSTNDCIKETGRHTGASPAVLSVCHMDGSRSDRPFIHLKSIIMREPVDKKNEATAVMANLPSGDGLKKELESLFEDYTPEDIRETLYEIYQFAIGSKEADGMTSVERANYFGLCQKIIKIFTLLRAAG